MDNWTPKVGMQVEYEVARGMDTIPRWDWGKDMGGSGRWKVATIIYVGAFNFQVELSDKQRRWFFREDHSVYISNHPGRPRPLNDKGTITEPQNQSEIPASKCSCTMNVLMVSGCQCGCI